MEQYSQKLPAPAYSGYNGAISALIRKNANGTYSLYYGFYNYMMLTSTGVKPLGVSTFTREIYTLTDDGYWQLTTQPSQTSAGFLTGEGIVWTLKDIMQESGYTDAPVYYGANRDNYFV